MEKRFISVKELAVYLGISVYTVYAWVSTRKIPHHKIGRLPKFDPREINQWLDEHKIASVE